MRNVMLCIGGVLGLLSVIMGASADHFLVLTDAQQHSPETAIRYNMIYAALIVACALHDNMRWPSGLFALGCIIFSGSIYLSLLLNMPVLTYVTPIGGITLMSAWAAVFIVGLKRR